MKINYFFILLFFTGNNLIAQSDFESALIKESKTLATELASKGKIKIAVWDFTDLDNNVTTFGKFLSENMSVYIANSSMNIKVVDRNNINTVMKEHKLNSDGFIDVTTAKELGKLVAVSAIVTGKITVFSSYINVTMKVLDTESLDIIVSQIAKLPLDENARELLGIASTNKGFNNSPLNSNEQINNPETVNKKCETINSGDYCFQNKTNRSLRVRVWDLRGQVPISISVSPGQTQCVYELPEGAHIYEVDEPNPPTQQQSSGLQWNSSSNYQTNNQSTYRPYRAQGQVKVEKCQSKTFSIQ